jgi:hypothetical protein
MQTGRRSSAVRPTVNRVWTATIGLLGVVVGVLLGGGVQLLVAWQERRATSKRAARLLFGDCQLCLEAVGWLTLGQRRWVSESAPPLEGWRRHREALAGAMDGPAFQTVDGAFYRVAGLVAWIETDDDLTDIEVDAEETTKQLKAAAGLLLLEGFSGGELERMQREKDADESES